LDGDGMRNHDLTPAEQEQVIHRLAAGGRSIRHIATLLGSTKRPVARRRAHVIP